MSVSLSYSILCGTGAWASGKHRIWLDQRSASSPVGAVCKLGFIFDLLFIKFRRVETIVSRISKIVS